MFNTSLKKVKSKFCPEICVENLDILREEQSEVQLSLSIKRSNSRFEMSQIEASPLMKPSKSGQHDVSRRTMAKDPNFFTSRLIDQYHSKSIVKEEIFSKYYLTPKAKIEELINKERLKLSELKKNRDENADEVDECHLKIRNFIDEDLPNLRE